MEFTLLGFFFLNFLVWCALVICRKHSLIVFYHKNSILSYLTHHTRVKVIVIFFLQTIICAKLHTECFIPILWTLFRQLKLKLSATFGARSTKRPLPSPEFNLLGLQGWLLFTAPTTPIRAVNSRTTNPGLIS